MGLSVSQDFRKLSAVSIHRLTASTYALSLIALNKVARRVFPLTGTLTSVEHAGDMLYIMGLVVGILLWGFAVVWFVVAIAMIICVAKFPFNMGWWGFIFPIGEFKLSNFYLEQTILHRACRCIRPPDDSNWRGI